MVSFEEERRLSGGVWVGGRHYLYSRSNGVVKVVVRLRHYSGCGKDWQPHD